MAEANKYPVTANDMRELLLKGAPTIIDEMNRLAKTGEPDNPNVDPAHRRYMFDALIPMIHEATDKVDLSALASLTPIERGDKIIEAMLLGQISSDDAKNVIEVISSLGGEDGEDTSQQLVINIQQTNPPPPQQQLNEAIEGEVNQEGLSIVTQE